MPISKVGNRLKQGGFTLIEAIVTFLLLASISAVVVPSFNSSYQNIILKSAVRKVAGNLRYARASAISLNRSVSLRFDLANDRIITDNNKTFEIPKNVTFDFGEMLGLVNTTVTQVGFHPHGGSTGGEFVMHNHSRYFLLRINPLTGKVSIENHEKD